MLHSKWFPIFAAERQSLCNQNFRQGTPVITRCRRQNYPVSTPILAVKTLAPGVTRQLGHCCHTWHIITAFVAIVIWWRLLVVRAASKNTETYSNFVSILLKLFITLSLQVQVGAGNFLASQSTWSETGTWEREVGINKQRSHLNWLL